MKSIKNCPYPIDFRAFCRITFKASIRSCHSWSKSTKEERQVVRSRLSGFRILRRIPRNSCALNPASAAEPQEALITAVARRLGSGNCMAGSGTYLTLHIRLINAQHYIRPTLQNIKFYSILGDVCEYCVA